MGIFEPYRAIGYITTGVPFSVQRLGTETFVTVSVGKSFQIYNCSKLSLVMVGPQFPKKIRSIASFRDYTFAAYGKHIAVVKRAHQVGIWSRHEAKVNLLFLFGEHILSVDIEKNMFIWAFKGMADNLDPVGHFKLDDNFTPTCLMHPDTYLNKVILGSQEGSLQLWNINSREKLYEFSGWRSSITCCAASPALDVIAVGCADGKIHVHNIRYDEELVTFTHSTHGAVTALSFRTDGQPLLASGGSSGVLSIWNLEKRKLQSIVREAHDSSIISLHFLANEPVLMSSSMDNSIKMWIFDSSNGNPRLLRFRSGHSAPPLCIRFYANGRHILSAGQDRAFRLFSVIQDQQSKELSQRHVSKRAKKLKLKEEEIKLKPVIAFDCVEFREQDWCNVVTCHMDTTEAYIWRLQKFVLGEHILRPCSDNPAPIKACSISSCGNFAVLGTASGWIERFNLQSGVSRGSYLDISEGRSCAHNGEVVGLACDSTNTLLISAGYHGDIKVWDFKRRELRSRWEIDCSLVKIAYHQGNGLLATIADDLVIRLFDVIASRIVRKFEGHTDRITDLCFSEDGKWLLSSSMDGSLRVWDVILARQVDAIHVDVAITALSLSPNMDILATTHVDQNGVYLWVNRCMFTASSSINTYASGNKIVSVKLPSVSSLEGVAGQDTNKTTLNHTECENCSCFAASKQQIPTTTHVDQNGADLWDNPCMFLGSSDANTHVGVDKIVSVKLPSISSVEGDMGQDISEITLNNTELEDCSDFAASTKKIPDLVTLSLLPKSQWQSLINLDVIKVRNEPVEPPKKLENAPFFLPSVPSLSGEILFKSSEVTKEKDITMEKVVNKRRYDVSQSQFVQFLHTSADMNNFSAFTEFIKSLSPSTLDMELRLLQIIDYESQQEIDKRSEFITIELLLDYLIHEITYQKNFEFIQAVVCLFLKIHGETIRCNSQLQMKSRKLLEVQRMIWLRMDKLFQSARCMVTFLSNSQF